MALTLSSIDNRYSLRTPTHHFQQGVRDVYSFALDLATLDGLLPQRVDEGVVREANRRLTPSHAHRIKEYLADKPDWVLGAILVGIAPDALEFVPGRDEFGAEMDNFGELKILSSRVNTLRIFDGQHRRRAIADIMVELENDDRRSSNWKSLLASSVPVVLYAEQDIKALRQMFADASKTKPIETNAVTRFDERDAFNLAAIWLAENSVLFQGRVEKERTTVPRTSECLVTINQLAAILKTLEVGNKGRVSKECNDCHLLDIEGLYKSCRTWADSFMPATRKEYYGLLTGEIINSEIPRLRATTFAYNATVIRIMAGCYYEWLRQSLSWESLAQFFEKSSLERGRGENFLTRSGVIAPNDIVLASRPIVTKAIDSIVMEAQSTIR
jgi:DGQHR domain-containing protein